LGKKEKKWMCPYLHMAKISKNVKKHILYSLANNLALNAPGILLKIYFSRPLAIIFVSINRNMNRIRIKF